MMLSHVPNLATVWDEPFSCPACKKNQRAFLVTHWDGCLLCPKGLVALQGQPWEQQLSYLLRLMVFLCL